jgi:hypothetical protein
MEVAMKRSTTSRRPGLLARYRDAGRDVGTTNRARFAPAALTLVCAGLALSHLACQSDKGCAVGALECSCTSAGACEVGLRCLAGRCLGPEGFTGTSGSTPSQPDRGNRFVGLYSGAASNFQYWVYYFFSGDGRVVRGKPGWRADGTLDFEATFAAAARADAGRHTLAGNQLVISWSDGKTTEHETSRLPSGDLQFRVGTIRFPPHVPCPQSRFDGTFTSKYSISVPDYSGGAGTVANLYRFTGLTLQRNGRFRYENVNLVSGNPQPGERPAPSPSFYPTPYTVSVQADNVKGEGTYDIQGIFMTLAFDDGMRAEDLFQCHETNYLSWGEKGLLQER